MLSIQIHNKKQNQRFEHSGGPLEFGRGPKRKVERFVVNDLFTSRDQLRIEEQPGGRIVAENLSQKQEVQLGDGRNISVGATLELALPIRLILGQTAIDIEPVSPDSFNKQSLQTVGGAERDTPPPSLADLGDSPPAEVFANWLEKVIGLLGSTSAAPEMYQNAARTLFDLIGLDVGLVLLRNDFNWEVVGQHPPGEQAAKTFSRTLLTHVAAEKRTFYNDLKALGLQTDSLRNVEAVVVSPILGTGEAIIGALYGVRNRQVFARGGFRPLEAQVVQLLAAAVGSHMTRTVTTQTRNQFEQSFPADVVRELERNAGLLEGRLVDVSLLVAGLHDYGALADRLGPADACKLVRDIFDRFSERVAEQGGVVVEQRDATLLAMWNAPLAQLDHPVQAGGAALGVTTDLGELNNRWQAKTGEPLRIGIGLNSGRALVGNTGSSQHFRYVPHGAAVELARAVFRATETLGQPILVTGSVQNQLPDTMATRRLCQARFPGHKEPIPLYELHGVKGAADWVAQRDAYEGALMQYEFGQWAKACQTLLPLVKLAEHHPDQPTLLLMQRTCECLAHPPEAFDPVFTLD